MMVEYSKEFPYFPPNERFKDKYKNIFSLKEPLKIRPAKKIFDLVFTLGVIFLVMPLFIVIFISYFLDGLIHPEHKGPVLASYISATCGRKFMKYKFRLPKESFGDETARKKGEYSPEYHSQSDFDNLTCVGKILKKYYLDEMPQFFNILKGDMSFVGPRALAYQHYVRDLKNGNITRKVLRAGICSQTHVRKGTPDVVNLDLEYGYIENYIKLPAISLLCLDIRIIARGIKQTFEGKGL